MPQSRPFAPQPQPIGQGSGEIGGYHLMSASWRESAYAGNFGGLNFCSVQNERSPGTERKVRFEHDALHSNLKEERVETGINHLNLRQNSAYNPRNNSSRQLYIHPHRHNYIRKNSHVKFALQENRQNCTQDHSRKTSASRAVAGTRSANNRFDAAISRCGRGRRRRRTSTT